MVDYEMQIANASATYDPERRVAYIVYRGQLSAVETLAVYEWLEKMYKQVGTEGFRGQIFDFREVTEFAPDNLKAARRSANRMNMIVDTSQIPVALLIGNFYHEEMLRSGMRVNPENIRKRIVWNEADAYAYIAEKHSELHKKD